MNIALWLDSAFCVRVVLTLLHFLWQGTVVALPVFVESSSASVTTKRHRFEVRLVAGDRDTSPADELPGPPDNSGTTTTIRVLREVLSDESSVATATAVAGRLDRPEVLIRLKPSEWERWATVTETNIGRRLAMVFDGKVLCAPSIRAKIPHGLAAVVGNFTWAEAFMIAETISAASGRSRANLPGEPPQRNISLGVKEAPLEEVIRWIARKAALNVVVPVDLVRGRRVTAELDDVPATEALRSILRTHGLELILDSDGLRRVVPHSRGSSDPGGSER